MIKSIVIDTSNTALVRLLSKNPGHLWQTKEMSFEHTLKLRQRVIRQYVTSFRESSHLLRNSQANTDKIDCQGNQRSTSPGAPPVAIQQACNASGHRFLLVNASLSCCSFPATGFLPGNSSLASLRNFCFLLSDSFGKLSRSPFGGPVLKHFRGCFSSGEGHLLWALAHLPENCRPQRSVRSQPCLEQIARSLVCVWTCYEHRYMVTQEVGREQKPGAIHRCELGPGLGSDGLNHLAGLEEGGGEGVLSTAPIKVKHLRSSIDRQMEILHGS